MCGCYEHHWHHDYHCHQHDGGYERPYRRFPNSDDDLSRLQDRIQSLKQETQALEDRLAGMKRSE
jgi:hypothetical protein